MSGSAAFLAGDIPHPVFAFDLVERFEHGSQLGLRAFYLPLHALQRLRIERRPVPGHFAFLKVRDLPAAVGANGARARRLTGISRRASRMIDCDETQRAVLTATHAVSA